MKRKGSILALLGLLLGLLIGLGVVLTERYLAGMLMELLGDELRASCPCSLIYEDVDVSLLTLNATAKNLGIEEGGQKKLLFKRAKADFSISKIRERKIFITNLRLIKGHSEGVGPDSATFKFIDYLAAPIPPELDRPDRWKLKLLKLELFDSTFKEQLDEYTLQGRDVNLALQRTESDDFNLTSHADNLTISGGTIGEEERGLGSISTDMFLEDQYIEFKSLQFRRADSNINFAGMIKTKEENALTGALSYFISAKSLPVPAWVDGSLAGRGQVQGSVHRPELDLSIHNLDGKGARAPLSLRLADPGLVFEEIDGRFALRMDERGSAAPSLSLTANGPGIQLNTVKPLLLSNRSLSGSLQLNAPELLLGMLRAEDLFSTLNLSGNLTRPNFDIAGSYSAAKWSEQIIPALDFKGTFSGRDLDLNLTGRNSFKDRLAGQLSLVFGDEEALRLNPSYFTLKELPIGGERSSLGLSVDASASGKLELSAIEARANYSLTGIFEESQDVLTGEAILKQGKLASAFADSRKTLTGEIVSEKLESGAVTVTAAARDFKPLTLILPESEENSRCLETSADLKLDLSIGSPLDSKGTLSLSKLDLGCQPYKLSLQGAPQLSITGGRINFPGVTLQSANSRFSLDGYLAKQEDSALEITGSINLQTLLPLARRVDDLKGLINLSLVLSGPLGAPSIDGHATLSEAGFDIEQTDISASNLSGRIDFDGDKIEVPSLEGELNQGAVSITAQIYPFDLVSSNVEVSFEDGIFEPLPDVSMSVSSQLGYAISESGRPSLKGRVLINSAEFQKNIDFFAILRNLTRSVFTRKLAETEAVAVSDLPLIDLDLEIVAPGNLFIISNILALELKSDLRLTGTLREPVVQGKLETLSGWLGFRDRRFDITSGQLIFRPPNLDPYFDVLAETNVRSRQGDNVLIFLQMTGPLSNPIFALTSDRGLTERELIQLVTSATDLRGRAGTNVLGQSFKVEPLPFLRDRSLLGFGRLIRDFARIDRLGVEPTFNPQRGTIEPTVVAEKNITDRLDLVGESSLSGSEGESRAELIYTLSPKLSVAGILETITSRDTTAAGADLTYTILEQHTRFLEIEIEGNDYISSSELLDSIKLHENSRVKVPDLHQLESRLTTFIQEQGYFEGDAKVFCPVADGELCREISLIVSEGSPSYVTKVEFEGIIPDVSKAAEKLSDLPSKTPAKSSFKEQMLYHIIGAMRSEGYISARAEANYEPLDAGKVLLRIKTEPGDPVSFVFKGNTRFTPEEFLNTINFFERKQPFGRNTINILVDNIDRKYREAGYLYCTVSHEITSEPDSSRVIYVISIEEGPQVPVKEVIFEGNRSISDQRLDELIGDLTDSTKDDLLYPDFAVAEQLEQNQRVLVNLFVEEGFPDVQLSYRLEPSADEKEVVIKYIIEEGAAVKADSFRIRGLPDGFPSPEVPEAPYSIPKANRFIESLAGALEREGYFSAQVSTRIVLEESALEVLAVPGDVTLISDILVQGQSIVSKDTLLENITVKAGDPWSPAKLDDSKKKLLNLGLFARVEFEALDGAVDSLQEILVIRVIERSMQTLQVGTGVNSEFGLHLFGEASDRSYFADGRSITARLDTYYDRAEAEISQGIASLTFSDPTLFKSSYGFVSDLRFQRLDQDTYEFDLDRISLASYLHRNLNENLSSTLGYTIFTEDLTDVTPGAILGEFDEGDVRLGFISGTLIYDRRDSPLTPRSGYYLGLDYNIASEPLGSEANYGGFGGRASFIKPLPTRLREWAIAWQGRAASQWTFAGTDFVPISQRYYLGGRNSVRGFRENSLGPRGDDDAVQGGDLLAFQNLELRYFLSDDSQLHVFFDAGTVFLQDISVSLEDVRTSSGFGFRYLSPIGPIGADLGIPLDEKSGEPSFRLHFSIGTNF